MSSRLPQAIVKVEEMQKPFFLLCFSKSLLLTLLVCSEAGLHLKADLWVTSVSKTETLLREGLKSGLRRLWIIHSCQNTYQDLKLTIKCESN